MVLNILLINSMNYLNALCVALCFIASIDGSSSLFPSSLIHKQKSTLQLHASPRDNRVAIRGAEWARMRGMVPGFGGVCKFLLLQHLIDKDLISTTLY